MERHVEKVQTVGNLLDSRDNFTASRNLLLKNCRTILSMYAYMCVHIYRNNYCAGKIIRSEWYLIILFL